MPKVKPDIKIFISGSFLIFLCPLSLGFAVDSLINGRVHIQHLALLLVLYVSSLLGITLGYHRLVAHQSYRAHPILKWVLLVLGAQAMQGPPMAWASHHLKHHKFADRSGDPHTPQEGFWHAHCGWILHQMSIHTHQYGRRFLKDPIVMHVSHYYFPYALIGFVLPLWLLGGQGVLWAGFIRLLLTSHVTWSVNSIGHRFGQQAFSLQADQSRNNLWLALLSMGEGWHNNHHRCASNAVFAQHWYQMDLGGGVLRVLQYLKLVHNVKHKKIKQ